MGVLEVDADNVRDALRRWAPAPGRSEAEYERQIYEFLQRAFPGAVFHRQYWRGKTRADVYVEFDEGARVVVEAKYDLSDRGEYHRLIGQTYEYLTEWKAEVLVVLCGSTESSIAKLVKRAVSHLSESTNRKAHTMVAHFAST